MEIEKLIKHMREEAQDYRSGRTLGRAFADAEDVLDEAATALRPITREQVAEVWRGEWIDCSNGWMCSRCEHDNTYAKPFCPNCGAPMTDKAVDMVMERLEEICK